MVHVAVCVCAGLSIFADNLLAHFIDRTDRLLHSPHLPTMASSAPTGTKSKKQVHSVQMQHTIVAGWNKDRSSLLRGWKCDTRRPRFRWLIGNQYSLNYRAYHYFKLKAVAVSLDSSRRGRARMAKVDRQTTRRAYRLIPVCGYWCAPGNRN